MQRSPQSCPKCGWMASPETAAECARCGVVFSKLADGRPRATLPAPFSREPDLLSQLWRRALTVPADVTVIEVAGRAAMWLVLLVLGWSYVTSPIERSQVSPSFVQFVLARVNLVFHEAGHVLFRILGDFMATLGGSLFQVLVPLLCTAAFLTRHLNAYGASVTLWWMGQSLIDLAPYIYDARSQSLLLLGGVTGADAPGYHDWNNLLTRLGWLRHDHTLGRLAHGAGSGLIALGLVWGAYLLILQHRAARRSST